MPISTEYKNSINSQLSANLAAAMSAGDTEAAAKAMTAYAASIQDQIIAEARQLCTAESDAAVLAARGGRSLTSQETKYYQKVIENARSANPKMALTDLEIAMPETTIDRVFEDLKANHPLLAAIRFTNTNGKIKMVINKGGAQLAIWGKLTAGYEEELSGSLAEIDTGLYTLSAFIPISKAMLDLGPVWLDRYIRTVLSEAIANGMENGAINGNGKDSPIGMTRVVGSSAITIDGVYAEKTAVKITSFKPEKYGELISRLAINSETHRPRPVNSVILICNPVDYLTKILPATCLLTPQGTYVKDIFPVPTKVIPSEYMAVNKVIIGIADRYFMPIGTPSNGKIEYDDSVAFMKRERVYGAFLYGNGMPLDNNAFIVGDITDLEPLRYAVSTLSESYYEDDEGEEEPTYTLTSSEPEDWATNYNDYYTLSGGVYVKNNESSAPEWAENTYYAIS